MTKIEIPSFASEAEEAQWWFDNREALDDEFLAAAAEGRLTEGTLARRFGLVPNIIEINPQDALLAQKLANERGLDYELFVQNLIHEALLKDALLLDERETEQKGTPAAIAA